MNYHEWYAGRLVLDTDLDDTSDWILEAFEHAAYDASLSQDDATLNPKEYGGIVRGLGVILYGAAANLQVRVALGGCYDEAGQRAATTALATITLTHTGLLAKGATSGPATISPVLINPSTGQEVWVSLYLKHAEITSNTKTDLTGASVDFDVTESFQFEIRAGTPMAPPATSRDSLANGRVLLADILIENPAGTIQIKTNGVCASNDDLDVLGYGLNDTAALDGRRSDYITCENPTDFPAWRFAGAVEQRMAVRGNPREALFQLCTALARQTAVAGPPRQPAGAELIGRAADTGAAAANRTAGAQTIAIGNLDTQMAALLDIFSDALMRGGGNTLQPQTALDGLLLETSGMDAQRYLLKLKSITGSGGGSSAVHRMLGTPYGHKHSPHDFFDDFMIIGGGSNEHPAVAGTPDPSGPWFVSTTTNGKLYLQNERGGVVRMGTGASVATDDRILIATGLNTSTPMRWWSCGAAPWAIMQVRFRVVSTLANRLFRIGFWDDSPGTHTSSAVYIEFETAVHATRLGLRAMTGGVPGTVVSLLDPLVVDTWYTVNMAMVDDQHVAAQLNSGGAWVTADAGGALATGGYTLGVLNQTKTTSERFLDLDQIGASDGIAIADMLA